MSTFIPITSTGGRYAVNINGEVKNLRTQRIMKPCLTIHGYWVVSVYDPSKGKTKFLRVHRALAEAFIPNPENKREVNHKSGVKTDNRIDNLEWATPFENQHHKRNVLGKCRGDSCHNHTLSEIDVIALRTTLFDTVPSNLELANMLRVTPSAISRALKGDTWKHLNDQYPPRARSARLATPAAGGKEGK